jgi:hypothetical protein
MPHPVQRSGSTLGTPMVSSFRTFERLQYKQSRMPSAIGRETLYSLFTFARIGRAERRVRRP